MHTSFSIFHILSGCETTSSTSLEMGKKIFYETWELIPETSELFVILSTIKNPKETSENCFKGLDKSFVLLYCVSVNVEDVNSARRVLFI